MTVQEVLQECRVEGNIIKLPAYQLDRKLYMDVAKALNGIGGKWVGGKVYGFVFPSDPSELLQRIAYGEEKINLKKDFQFFETPADLADTMVRMADIHPDHDILEPSAGMGAIVKAINRVLPEKIVDCYEIMPTNIIILEKNPNVNLVGKDFLNENNGKLYDRIIANPPFAKNQDIDHIREMYKRLKEGGILVTLSSLHWQVSSNRKETEFSEWLDEIDADVRKVPAGTFKESGTGIETAMIKIKKAVSEQKQEIAEKNEVTNTIDRSYMKGIINNANYLNSKVYVNKKEYVIIDHPFSSTGKKSFEEAFSNKHLWNMSPEWDVILTNLPDYKSSTILPILQHIDKYAQKNNLILKYSTDQEDPQQDSITYTAKIINKDAEIPIPDMIVKGNKYNVALTDSSGNPTGRFLLMEYYGNDKDYRGKLLKFSTDDTVISIPLFEINQWIEKGMITEYIQPPEIKPDFIESSKVKNMNTIKINSTKVKNWDEIPVVWKNTKNINKINYRNHPDDPELLRLIDMIASKDELKPALLGMYHDENGFTATDGNCLLHIPEPNKDIETGIYPTLQTKKTYPNYYKDYHKEKYPDYVAAIPNYFGNSFNINCYKLMQYCNVAIKYSNTISTVINFKPTDGEIIGLSGAYVIKIMEIFLKLGFKDVYISYTAHNRPVAFSNDEKPQVGKSYIILLMPIVIKMDEDSKMLKADQINYGSFNFDYMRHCAIYYDFSIDAIINDDGSKADFKMYYGEYDILSKTDIALLKAVIPKKAIIPILEYFFSDGTNIFATDLETSVCVKFKYLEKGLYRLLDNAAEYQDEEEDMIDDYPKFPEAKDIYAQFVISPDFLKHITNNLSDMVLNDDLKPSLEGIAFRKTYGETFFAATNGNVLGKISANNIIDIKTDKDEVSVIMPTNSNPKALPTFADTDDSPITCNITPINIFFENTNVKLVQRIIDERFPDVNSVAANKVNTKFVCSMTEFMKLLKSKQATDFIKKNKQYDVFIEISMPYVSVAHIELWAMNQYGNFIDKRVEDKILIGEIDAKRYSNPEGFEVKKDNLLLITGYFFPNAPSSNNLHIKTFNYKHLMKITSKIYDYDLVFTYNDDKNSLYTYFESNSWAYTKSKQKDFVLPKKSEIKSIVENTIIVPEPPKEPEKQPEVEKTQEEEKVLTEEEYIETIEVLKDSLEFASEEEKKDLQEAIDILTEIAGLNFAKGGDIGSPVEKTFWKHSHTGRALYFYHNAIWHENTGTYLKGKDGQEYSTNEQVNRTMKPATAQREIQEMRANSEYRVIDERYDDNGNLWYIAFVNKESLNLTYSYVLADLYKQGGTLPQKGTPDWHQLQIARKTVNMPDAILGVMGGMSKEEAQEIIDKYDKGGEVETNWKQYAENKLLNKIVKAVGRISKNDAEVMGWSNMAAMSCILIEFTDGTFIIPCADDEMNEAGYFKIKNFIGKYELGMVKLIGSHVVKTGYLRQNGWGYKSCYITFLKGAEEITIIAQSDIEGNDAGAIYISNLNKDDEVGIIPVIRAYESGGSFEKGGTVNVGGYNLVYEKWSPIMGGNGISGTIRTSPENYYVATIRENGEISFLDLESMTSDIDRDKVKRLWNDKLIPDAKKFEEGGSIENEYFNWKDFSIKELNDAINPFNNKYYDLSVTGVKNKKTGEQYIDQKGKKGSNQKETRFTISDYGHYEIRKGSENLYLDVDIYPVDQNDSNEYTLSLYTKEDHDYLKHIARSIIRQLEKGGKLFDGKDKSVESFPNQVSVYVPSTSNVSKKINKAAMSKRVKVVETFLAKLFGGFSSSELIGGYRSQNGKLVKEDVMKVTSFSKDSDWGKKKQSLFKKIALWCKEWGQESIGFEHENDLYYIDATYKSGGTLKTGIKVEKEHRDLYLKLKKRLAAKGVTMPMTEKEFYAFIAKKHISENEDYYDLLLKYVENKKS